jgi:transposase
VRLWGMRQGIIIEVTAADRAGLQSIIRDRNSPQKHVWRARIIVLTTDGKGTTAISRAVGKGKTVVWRWQERFMYEGVKGLTRDKTGPSRIPPLPAETIDRVVALTNQEPPHEATHWTAVAMAKRTHFVFLFRADELCSTILITTNPPAHFGIQTHWPEIL